MSRIQTITTSPSSMKLDQLEAHVLHARRRRRSSAARRRGPCRRPARPRSRAAPRRRSPRRSGRARPRVPPASNRSKSRRTISVLDSLIAGQVTRRELTPSSPSSSRGQLRVGQLAGGREGLVGERDRQLDLEHPRPACAGAPCAARPGPRPRRTAPCSRRSPRPACPAARSRERGARPSRSRSSARPGSKRCIRASRSAARPRDSIASRRYSTAAGAAWVSASSQ